MAGSVDDFERRMEFLAHAEVNGTTGRWIVTPRKGARFVGDAERRKARVRDRRRRVLVFLLEAIGISFLIGLVPPLRVVWNVHAGARDPARRVRLDADLDEAPDASPIRRRRSRERADPGRPRRRVRGPVRDRGPERARARDVQRPRGRSRRATGCTSSSDPPPPAERGPLRTRPLHPRSPRREERGPRAGVARGPSIDPRERERDPRDPSTGVRRREGLIGESRAALDEGLAAVAEHADIRHAGYLQDAQKEYAEANLTMALGHRHRTCRARPTSTSRTPPISAGCPTRSARAGGDSSICFGEASVEQAERLLAAMEEMYGVLVTMDYPDAITMNLRRATDVSRSLIEKTRGDLSISVGPEGPPRRARSPRGRTPRQG